MKYLRDKNIGLIGSVKGNMLEDCPLPTKNEFKNNQRVVAKGLQNEMHWCRDCDVE